MRTPQTRRRLERLTRDDMPTLPGHLRERPQAFCAMRVIARGCGRRFHRSLITSPWDAKQTASKFPFRWWGMNSTLSGRHQLNGQLRPHSAEEGPLDAFFILTRQNGRFVT